MNWYQLAMLTLPVLALLLPGPLCRGAQTQATAWRIADAPLLTRWARDVSPEHAHPEYPRPQMVRKAWLNLNGLWGYAITDRDSDPPASAAFTGQILVPYPIESALSGVRQHVDENHRLWYRRTFTVPAAWSGKRVLLHFGAVDWETTVILNGRTIGTHRGGYDGFSFDVTDALTAGGPQDLIVGVFDPTEGTQPRGKQSRKPEGIFYTPTTGIWQTVWLEPVAPGGIDSLQLTPDLDHRQLALRVIGREGASGTIEATALDGVRAVAHVSGPLDSELRLTLPAVKLWSPDHPFLYSLKIDLIQNGSAIDHVDSYFGMRKIALGKDAQGRTRLFLNGKFLFQVGTLDQGFWPDGIYSAPTDAALRSDIAMLKRLGFNMTRKHVKVEPDRWYYWCDRLGLLVWQDMPSTFIEEGKSGPTPEIARARRQFEQELERLLVGRGNHPSIVMWVVFNEGWGQYDTERLTHWVKERDPSRLVDNASGWTDHHVGDVVDMHNYPGPGSPDPAPDRAAVLGEFGGLGLGVDGHTWAKRAWGYRQMDSTSKLTHDYVRLLQRAWALKDSPGLSAVVYTQTTDVETECNGLMTYDRALVKVDPQAAADANRGHFAQTETVSVLVPSAQQARIEWRNTTAPPGDGWYLPGFDDSGWKTGIGGFGTEGTPGAHVGTTWSTDDIWLRRRFTLTTDNRSGLALWLHHDEDAEVYLNGVLAARVSGYITDYETFPISAEARAALKSGENLMAIHCHQTTGGQYIDAGIVRVQTTTK